MHKKLLFLALALMSCNALFSQDQFDIVTPATHDRPFRFAVGPKIGAGLGMGTDPTTMGYELDFKSGPALQAGIAGNIHFGRRLDSSPGGTGWTGLQAEALYGLRRLGVEQESLTIHCVEIPVLLQVYPVPALAIEAGATFVKFLKCSPETLQIGANAFDVSQLGEASDVMVSIGANYKIPAGLMFDLRYNLGTSNLAGNLDTKSSTLMISVAYLFSF